MSATTSTTGRTTNNHNKSLNVLSVGGSRNIGYYSSLKLLNAGATVTFLLRNPSIFENDNEIKPFLVSGFARVVKGDALVKDDVTNVWTEASRDRPVDFLLFTLGGLPKFHLIKGFVLTPPNLVTISLLNVLSTMPSASTPPKIITISSTGLTPASHKALPLALKPLYAYLLAAPHADKLGAEQVIHHCAGWSWHPSSNSGTNSKPTILPNGWKEIEGLPKESSLKHVVVIRPALLTDGESVGDRFEAEGSDDSTPPYRVSTQELRGYTVSRKDVAHFVTNLVLNQWDEFDNKILNISY